MQVQGNANIAKSDHEIKHRKAKQNKAKGIDRTKIDKNSSRASYLAVRGPYGPLTVPARAVHGLFRISKPVRGP